MPTEKYKVTVYLVDRSKRSFVFESDQVGDERIVRQILDWGCILVKDSRDKAEYVNSEKIVRVDLHR